jgi:hypothetical protein
MAYAPTVTPYVDLNPGPRVDILFSTLPAAVQTITVVGISTAGEYNVRGAENAFAAGGFTVTDSEVPLGVPVTFRGHMFGVDGADLGYTDPTVVTVQADPDLVYLSDPLAPANAVAVIPTSRFGQRKTRSRSGAVYRTGNRTVALFGPVGLLEGLDLTVETFSVADADTLLGVVTALPVLVRSMPPIRLPRQLYVAIPEPQEEDVDVAYGGDWTIQALAGDEVSRTEVDVVVPVVTWQTFIDAFPTWDAMNARYSTWLDAMTNPPNEGDVVVPPTGMVETPAGSGRYTTGDLAAVAPTAYSTEGLQPVDGRPTAYRVAS